MATNDIKYTLNAQLADNSVTTQYSTNGKTLLKTPRSVSWAKHPQEVATMAEAPKAAAVWTRIRWDDQRLLYRLPIHGCISI